MLNAIKSEKEDLSLSSLFFSLSFRNVGAIGQIFHLPHPTFLAQFPTAIETNNCCAGGGEVTTKASISLSLVGLCVYPSVQSHPGAILEPSWCPRYPKHTSVDSQKRVHTFV